MSGQGRPLSAIGEEYQCDKFTRHDFAPIYERFLAPLRDQPIKLLEIGIGGEDFAVGGESLKTWEEYFENGRIFGIDIFPKATLNSARIQTFVCDQRDTVGLSFIAREHGPFDVIIDDGSHHNDDAVVSLQVLFAALRPGGVYAIEDLQTSYWASYGGSSIAPDCLATSASWLKRSIDYVNRGELVETKGKSFPRSLDIAELHVFHNIAVLIKQTSDGQHASRVLTPAMRADIAEIDQYRFGHLTGIVSSIDEQPSHLGEILTSVSSIMAGTTEGGQSAVDWTTTGTTLSVVFTGHQEAVSNLSEAVNQQNSYIQAMEEQKNAMEVSLLAHSEAVKNYERTVDEMRAYIDVLEQRCSSISGGKSVD